MSTKGYTVNISIESKILFDPSWKEGIPDDVLLEWETVKQKRQEMNSSEWLMDVVNPFLRRHGIFTDTCVVVDGTRAYYVDPKNTPK